MTRRDQIAHGRGRAGERSQRGRTLSAYPQYDPVPEIDRDTMSSGAESRNSERVESLC
jgi:hypothetical protein